MQIYNEKIFDLLNPSIFSIESALKNGLHLRYRNDCFSVENLLSFECHSLKEMIHFIKQGLNNRFVSSSKYNHLSSRSHSILTITLEAINLLKLNDTMLSNLHLVDLAGSERGSTSSHDTKLQKEAIEINKSLFALRQVILMNIEAQQGKAVYVPYRDSKLTSILKQSIGGNSYCLMISNMAPDAIFFEDNMSTLLYSSKASIIRNKPEKNKDPKNVIIDDLNVFIHVETNRRFDQAVR